MMPPTGEVSLTHDARPTTLGSHNQHSSSAKLLVMLIHEILSCLLTVGTKSHLAAYNVDSQHHLPTMYSRADLNIRLSTV